MIFGREAKVKKRVIAISGLMLCLLLLFTLQSASALSFNDGSELSGDEHYVEIVDIDGDGDMDFFGEDSNDNICWYENDGFESFSKHQIHSLSETNYTYYINASDLDGDGDIDFVVCFKNSTNPYPSTLTWFENDGSESFTEHVIYSYTGAADYFNEVYCRDIDGDGDIDLLTTAAGDDEVVWWENDGSESFTKHVILDDNFMSANSPNIVDIDGDGDMDFLFLHSGSGLWCENDGSESFTEYAVYSDEDDWEDCRAVDLDEDGNMDVVMAGVYGVAYTLHDGGADNFILSNPATHEYILDNSGFDTDDWSLVAEPADLDGDGDLDVVASFRGDIELRYFSNDGSESFTENNIADIETIELSLVDMDSDGDIDIISDGGTFWVNDLNPNTETKEATSVEENSATLNGEATSVDSGSSCGFRLSNSSGLVSNVTCAGTYDAGDSFSYEVSGLESGMIYYVQAWANTGSGFNLSKYNLSFLTKPLAPSNLTIDAATNSWINLSWTEGTGANNTVVVRKEGSPPTSMSDGDEVYNGTASFYNDTISSFKEFYYAAWSYAGWDDNHQYSDSFATVETQGVVLLVYNESDNSALNDWDVFISSQDGSDVYNVTSCDTAHVILNESMPYGEETMIHVEKDGYRARTFYYDLESGGIISLDFYLPPVDDSELYLLTVKNTYDVGIDDAMIEIKKYVSGEFKNMTVLYSHANGQVEVFLRPFTLYKIRISKEGYVTETDDYTPTDSIFTQDFQLLLDLPDGYTEPYLWDNITWSIEPDEVVHRTNISFYYNITSSTGQLEWYRMRVQYYNDSVGDWVTVFSQNNSDAGGGSISFTSENNSGRYRLDCWFKKDGFDEFQFGSSDGCREYIITWEELTESLEDIPDDIMFLIIICLAIAAVGVLISMGAGELSGLAGLIVMGIGAMLAPGLMIGEMAFWQVVLVAGIAYFAILYVLGRF